MTRILVTGGAGFIGSFLVERLVEDGHAVRVLDNLDPQIHPSGEPPALPGGVDFRRGDVRDRATCDRALDDVDAVVHAAAAVGVGQSMYRVEHYVDVNVRGTATLLDAIHARATPLHKLVVLTSMTVYGEGLYRRPADGGLLRIGIRSEADIRRFGWEPVDPHSHERLVPAPTSEHAELLGRNVYALSKRHQEEYALSVGGVYGFPVVCLRLFNVFGPRQSLGNPYTGVIAIFLSRLLSGEPPIVYEDGRQTRDFVSVHDVVRAVRLALTTAAADGTVVNIGSGVPREIGGIARTLARLTGRPAIEPRITHQFRRGDVRHCVADLSRARALGFTPAVAWEAGLAEIVEWARTARVDDRSAQAERELRERHLLGDAPLTPGGVRP